MKADLNFRIYHPHMFRHTFASNAMRNGVNMYALQQLMGHGDIKTTERYFHMNDHQVKREYKQKYKRRA